MTLWIENLRQSSYELFYQILLLMNSWAIPKDINCTKKISCLSLEIILLTENIMIKASEKAAFLSEKHCFFAF